VVGQSGTDKPTSWLLTNAPAKIRNNVEKAVNFDRRRSQD